MSIDCDVHNEVPRGEALYAYLPEYWVEHMTNTLFKGPTETPYPPGSPIAARAGSRPEDGSPPGSSLALLQQHVLDASSTDVAVLNCLYAIDSLHNPDAAVALASAVNDWQVAEWLDRDPRLRASMAIPFEHPAAAVAEIERRSSDKRFVQVMFTGRPHEPMGRRKYWPIYEACARNGLHVMSHAFGGYGNPITGTGWPSFYLEDHVGPAQAMQANITSLVAEGVFEAFPTLKVESVENGFGWIPSLCWRMDSAWSLLKSEVPHLRHAPSEYIRQHVYLTTQPVEEPHKPEYFLQMLEQYGEMTSHILFASDYPHWDADNPDMALPPHVPKAIANGIYSENARRLYGLP